MSRRCWAAGLCAVALCAATETCLSADTGTPTSIATSGYTLWQYAPPGWHWTPAPAEAPVAAATVRLGGTSTLTFTLPLCSLPGLDASRFRFGLASGFVANGPIIWLTPGRPLVLPEAASPVDLPVLGQTTLATGQVGVDGGVLRADLTFASPPVLETAWDLMGLVDADGDPATGYRGAEWLLQNVPLGSAPAPGLKVPWLEARPGIIQPGQRTTLTAWVLDDSGDGTTGARLALALSPGLRLDRGSDADRHDPFDLRPGEPRQFTWRILATDAGLAQVRLTVTAGDRRAQRTRWLTVVSQRDPRREYQTRTGDWLTYPARPTLQVGNRAPLTRIRPRPSAETQRNLFGITAHLPRTADDEDPFVPCRAVDGDGATCWASRWWRIAVPLEPEWLRVDVGRVIQVSGIELLPAWHDGGFAAAFTIDLSADGRRWETAVTEYDYKLQTAPEGDRHRVGDRSWQAWTFVPRPARFARVTATRLTQGATSFFCAPFEPFQLRIAEARLISADAEPLQPVAATASTIHRAWFNAPETTRRTWPLLLQSGVKLNRINQWGDRLDWATVERVKGIYRIPGEADRAITESHRAGVETLLTLDYGNNLYQQVKNAPDFGPTWHRGHPFLQCAPTTPEAMAGFANYCAFMAKHFRGRVKYFEIWNEENGWFFDDWTTGDRVEQVRAYGRLLKAAAQAIKQANPQEVVVFGGTAGSTLDYLRLALEEGAGPWVDVFAFHPYGHPTPEAAPDSFLSLVDGRMDWRPRPSSITNYEEEIAAMRRLLHRYNPRMQIWADEMNWFAPGEPPMPELGDQSELTQAKHLARFYAMNAWLGCGAIWWSLYNANGVQEWAVVRSSDGTPRAAYYAAQYAATILDDVRPARDIRPEVAPGAPSDLMVKAFRNGEGAVLVGLWRTSFGDDACKPAPVTVSLPATPRGKCELFDLLYGVRQSATADGDGDTMVIHDVLVGDWPVVLRLASGNRRLRSGG